LVILVARRAGNNTPPTKPNTTGGGSPNLTWEQGPNGGADSLSIQSGHVVANGSNLTSGTWTNANHTAAITLRAADATLALGATSQGNGNAADVTYPALSLQKTDGSSMGVRVAIRTTAATAMADPPPGWNNRLVQPAGAGALLTVHYRAGLTTDLTADTVAISGSSAWRALSFEVIATSTAPPPPPLTEGGIFHFWNGAAWEQVIAGGGGGANMSVGPAQPNNPGIGDLWFETTA